MPYISEDEREIIDPEINKILEVLKTKGQYNYTISRLLHNFLLTRGRVCYDTLSETHGLAQDVAAEFYRCVVSPYEDRKKLENGSVSELDS